MDRPTTSAAPQGAGGNPGLTPDRQEAIRRFLAGDRSPAVARLLVDVAPVLFGQGDPRNQEVQRLAATEKPLQDQNWLLDALATVASPVGTLGFKAASVGLGALSGMGAGAARAASEPSDGRSLVSRAIEGMGEGVRAQDSPGQLVGDRLSGAGIPAPMAGLLALGTDLLIPGVQGEERKILGAAKKVSAGDVVGGLVVRKEVPNTTSIGASFNDYEVLPGLRAVSMNNFPNLTGKSYSAKGNERIAQLAEQIRQSGELNPLIIAVDEKGAYILEGSHRVEALKRLGVDEFPAMVVVDKESLPTRGLGSPGPSTPSEDGFAYHATSAENLDGIAERGLVPHDPWYGTDQSAWPDGSTRKRVYATKNAGAAWQFAPTDGTPVLLRTKLTKAFKGERGTGDLYSERVVPRDEIEVMLSEGIWAPLRAIAGK